MYIIYWGNIEIMEKKMEATTVDLCYMGHMVLGILQEDPHIPHILSTQGGL